jgi:formamidopyrimidine-DNA glycosylase
MPELPEVETTVRSLRQTIPGNKIVGMTNDWPGHIALPEINEFQDRVAGSSFKSIARRGKYLIFALDSGDFLIIHLKMTGHLSVVDELEPRDPYAHTVFSLDSGTELRFRDVRKFGRIYLVADPNEVLGKLGPEPLGDSFTPELFHSMLRGRKRILKPLLLDQSFIAGIGNIYADEALHRAAIHPRRHSNSLSRSESHSLFHGIRDVLELAIKNNGASIDSYRKPDGTKGSMQNSLQVYGRSGEPCPRCGNIIQRVILGNRSTHFCPFCQK